MELWLQKMTPCLPGQNKRPQRGLAADQENTQEQLAVFACIHICFEGKSVDVLVIFRSTPPIWPNKVGLECPYVRPSTESFFDFTEIWYVGRGRWVIHNGMQYDLIQGQGHEPLKVGNSVIFKGYHLPHL